jgi:hypothetical protein
MANPSEDILAERDVPMARQFAAKLDALIEPALALAFGREWNWDERTPLLDNVDWPIEPRHAAGHSFRHTMPALVLEGMHDSEPNLAACPTDASSRANVRWKEHAPATGLSARGVTAPVTAWRTELRESRPAAAADQLPLVSVEESRTDDAAEGKKKIGKRR